jgi:hypothetical protein
MDKLIAFTMAICGGSLCQPSELSPFNCTQVLNMPFYAMPLMGSYSEIEVHGMTDCSQTQVIFMKNNFQLWRNVSFPLSNCTIAGPDPTLDNSSYTMYLSTTQLPATITFQPRYSYLTNTQLVFQDRGPEDVALPRVADANAMCLTFLGGGGAWANQVYQLPTPTFDHRINATHVALLQILPSEPCAPWETPNRTLVLSIDDPLAVSVDPPTLSPTASPTPSVALTVTVTITPEAPNVVLIVLSSLGSFALFVLLVIAFCLLIPPAPETEYIPYATAIAYDLHKNEPTSIRRRSLPMGSV